MWGIALITRLDLGRRNNPHMSFGHGAHHCLGSQLARMELQVAIGAVLERFPGLYLATEVAEVPWKSGKTIHTAWSTCPSPGDGTGPRRRAQRVH
jgi:cytochrome P450